MKLYLYEMKSRNKKILGVAIAIVFLVVVLPFILNIVIERKIINKLKELPEHILFRHTAIEADVFSGDLRLFSPYILIKGKTTDTILFDADFQDIYIKDLGYWDYLVNDKISLDAIILDQPVIKYRHNSKVKNKSYNQGLLKNLETEITVGKIAINNADILMVDIEKDSTILAVSDFNFNMNEINLYPNKTSKLEYKNFGVRGENLKWVLNAYDDLYVSNFNIAEDNASFNDLKLETRMSKDSLSKVLEKERDHFKIHIQNLDLSNMSFGFEKDNSFFFKSGKTLINSPFAEIYRDKLLPDDFTQKPLYSKMLRDLNFDLALNTIEIKNGTLKYFEKVNASDPAGELDFSSLNANITNVGNVFGNDETQINIGAVFMEGPQLDVDWNFKVQDSTDAFTFKAELNQFRADNLNQFIEPDLKVRLEGVLDKTYFSVYGNENIGNTDLRIKYDDFKISVLKDNGREKKKLLSGLINLFVSKDSNDKEDHFRYGKGNDIERDKTKSVFNFIWLNIKGGLLSAMTGDGEKD